MKNEKYGCEVPGMDMYKRVVCDRVMVQASEVLDQQRLLSLRSTLEVHSVLDIFTRGLVVSLSAGFPGVLKERIVVHEKYPRDWWQAVRERWLPAWWLKGHPVIYKYIDIERPIYERVCPHVEIPDRGSHIQFLAGMNSNATNCQVADDHDSADKE